MDNINDFIDATLREMWRTVHCCQSCGEVMRVCWHRNYEEVAACIAEYKPLCAECRTWSGA